VVAGGNFATPRRALEILDATIAEYRLFMLNAQAGVPDRDGVTLETPFVGPGMRGRERLMYFPCRLSLVPVLLGTALPPDVVLVRRRHRPAARFAGHRGEYSARGDRGGPRARGGLVVAQLNPRMPYTHGDAVLATGEIGYAIEADVPLPSPPPRPVSGTFAAIGGRVAALVRDGATLQLGIGAVPDAVLAALRDRQDLKVWSEMFSDGVLALDKAGALDPGQPRSGGTTPPRRPSRSSARSPTRGSGTSCARRGASSVSGSEARRPKVPPDTDLGICPSGTHRDVLGA
jgi:hypothetical protein